MIQNETGAVVPPPEFSVTWDEPGDEREFWVQDKMHWPDPLPILYHEFMPEQGVPNAGKEYGIPIRIRLKRINTYNYRVMGPPPLPPEELAALGPRVEEGLRDAMAQFGVRWEQEWLPEIKRYLADWDAFDLDGASMLALVDHLDQSVARLLRLWDVHFLIAIPMLVAPSQFDEIYRELLGKETAFDSFKLLQGLPNKTVETGHELWKLSRKALATPEVRRVLEERAAAEVIPALRASEEGRAFLNDLDSYLRIYGTRGDKVALIVETSWIEDPTTVIKSLKDFITQPDRNLEAELAHLAEEREQAVATARARLAGYPRPVVEQFEFLLQAAQTGTVLSEDHDFWIDFTSQYRVRRVILEFGRRFAAAGVIAEPNDVTHLTVAEIRETALALPRIDRKELIAERKAEIEHFRAIAAPPVLGTPPDGPPPEDPVGLALGKFFGGPPPPQTEPGVLRGTAGSPGVVRGTARIVRSLGEAEKLRPGDVLVAETTAPPWTPLFATAAAVVTDTGGILSHCAVVAREYGLPAVVGVGMATAVLQDGQTVEVDGNAGVVRVALA